MKTKDLKPDLFDSGHLVKKIDDLRGVGEGELRRYFPRRKTIRTSRPVPERTDPPRVKATEGLGLSRGRRFFSEC
ncbi:MAG: hypothetical protein DRP71_13435 [Verrucomicrobia bacterium]|nr:MAG: hypothetical protein DRP71_13435 [Verrucomicrobiota bacterium]